MLSIVYCSYCEFVCPWQSHGQSIIFETACVESPPHKNIAQMPQHNFLSPLVAAAVVIAFILSIFLGKRWALSLFLFLTDNKFLVLGASDGN